MTNANGEQQAVVLSGGGANGAYEVGVMKALFSGKSPTTNYQPLIPDMFCGISVGAYNAAFLTAQWDMYATASIANLEQAWLTQVCDSMTTCGNGIYKIRGNPLSLTNPYCYYPNPIHPFTQLAQDSAALAWDGVQRWVKSLDQSIRQVWAINRTVELVELALRATRALQDRSGDLTLAEFEPETMRKLQELYPGQSVSSHLSLDLQQGYLRQEIQNYSPLTIYLYRPKDSLGGPLGTARCRVPRGARSRGK